MAIKVRKCFMIPLHKMLRFRLFADDKNLFMIENPTTAAKCLNSDLIVISQWAAPWLLLFNPTKIESLIFSRKLNKPVHPPLYINDQQLIEVETHKSVPSTGTCVLSCLKQFHSRRKISLDIFLFGDTSLSFDTNEKIFEKVQESIITIKRFTAKQ